jgi:threonine dehydrogenase-like Zn-dependent dehydrogenase
MASNMVQIQVPQLKKENYEKWCIQFKALFGSQDLWEVDVVGIFRYRNTWPLCIEFLKTGKIDVKPLITHRFGFTQQEVEDAFETSARGGSAIKVMFNL